MVRPVSPRLASSVGSLHVLIRLPALVTRSAWSGVSIANRKTIFYQQQEFGFPQARPCQPEPGLAQACPAQARPKPSPGPACQISGSLEFQESGTLESKAVQQIQILNIKIRSAQFVGKVWITRNKCSQPHLGHFKQFFPWARKMQKQYRNIAYFPWRANGPYSPGLGSSSYIWQGW